MYSLILAWIVFGRIVTPLVCHKTEESVKLEANLKSTVASDIEWLYNKAARAWIKQAVGT